MRQKVLGWIGGLAVAFAVVGCGDDAHGPVLSSEVPSDVTPTESPTKADLDDYSWRMFVALNWPSENGAPSSSPIGTRPDAIRVWETYLDATTILEVRDGLHVRVPETAAGRALSADYYLQAGSDLPLIDANDNFLVNEFLVNDVWADFTIENGLTTTAGFARYAESHSAVLLPNGTMSIKASWQILTDANEATLSRYYVRDAVISVGASESATGEAFEIRGAKVGLVGLHIAQKTPSQQNWIWSTFEHVDLLDGDDPVLPVGIEGNLDSNRPPLLRSTGEYARSFAWTDPATGASTAADYVASNVARSPNELPYPAMNATWQDVLPAPWSSYRLVVTQWTGDRGRPEPKNTEGVSLAKNTSLETYLLGDQSIALQVPGVDTTNACPEPDDGSTLWAEIEQIELYFGYPETGRTTTTWSSCFMCHQLALYKWGESTADVLSTDYSFVYKTILPEIPCPSGTLSTVRGSTAAPAPRSTAP